MKQSKTSTLKKVKKVAIIFLIILVISLVTGIIVIGKMVNDGVLYQNKNNDTKSNSIKQLESWGYDIEAFHNKYQGNSFLVQSTDGNTVPGTIYFSEESQPWVILIHGAGGDHEFVIPYVEMFLEMNMNVLTYDQRGHGDNSDHRVTFGINETYDVEALVEYLNKEYNAETIMIHGQSMGGATAALYAAGEHGKEHLTACIIDSPEPGMELFLKDMFMEDNCSEGMAKTIIWCGQIYSGLFSHLNYKDGDTIEKAQNITVPTMVIVSTEDSVCLPQYVSQIFTNIPTSKKELVEFDCEHIKGIFEYKDKYYQEVSDFLKQVLQ